MEHEYIVLGGTNRAKIGRYMSVLSAGISGVLVFIVLSFVDISNKLGIPVNLPPTVLSLIGASSVFAVIYAVFEKFLWKSKYLLPILKIPDLAGIWSCDGTTLKEDGTEKYKWTGNMVIVQSWDKIRVRLVTKESSSSSVSAAIIKDEAGGCRLFYNYKNEPKLGNPELKPHGGFVEFFFSEDFSSAEGEYFTGNGRFSFGLMKLQKVV